MKCPWCAAELADNTQFCTTCGGWTGIMTKFSIKSAEETEKPPVALKSQASGPEPPAVPDSKPPAEEAVAGPPPWDGNVVNFAARFLGREFAGCKVEKHVADTPAYSEFICTPPSGNEKAILRIIHPSVSIKMRIQRLVKESKSVRHPNAVRALDSGESEGYYYVIIEHVECRTIAQIIKEGRRLSWQEAIKLLKGILPALKSAHEMAIIHRGISPWCVLIDGRGEPRIRDFGFEGLTGPEAGSPLSPEQVSGRGAVDARSDIYALGMVAYAAMTGRIPSVRPGSGQHRSTELQPLYSVVPDVPGLLDAIISRMTASDMNKRYQTADAVLFDIGKMDVKLTAADQAARKITTDIAVRESKRGRKKEEKKDAVQENRQDEVKKEDKKEDKGVLKEEKKEEGQSEKKDEKIEPKKEEIKETKIEVKKEEKKEEKIEVKKDGLGEAKKDVGIEVKKDVKEVEKEAKKEEKIEIKKDEKKEIRLEDKKDEKKPDRKEEKKEPETKERKDDKKEPEKFDIRVERREEKKDWRTEPKKEIKPDAGKDGKKDVKKDYLNNIVKEDDVKSGVNRVLIIAATVLIIAVAAFIVLMLGQGDKGKSASTGKQTAAVPAKSKELLPKFSNSFGMKFVLVKPGKFTQGSPNTEKERKWDEGPARVVEITKPFYMQTTEITQAEWKAVMALSDCRFKGDDLPVDSVSWTDAVKFAETLSVLDKHVYRLPTEAEWEYACRAGSSTCWCFGDNESYLSDYAWYMVNTYEEREGGGTFPVGKKKPNAWGLFDMHGNVCEWCSDWYAGEYESTGPAGDPKGPDAGKERVWRGGCWGNTAALCRSANRSSLKPDAQNAHAGFRLVMQASE
jgi:formylglycine-generating enzyme required for sulfatase activity/serine/threonine protein kinase